MDLEKIKEVIRRKPRAFLFVTCIYFLIVALLKWTIHPTVETFTFMIGSLIGVYFLDIAEVFFQLNPSPFRSVVFIALFVVVSPLGVHLQADWCFRCISHWCYGRRESGIFKGISIVGIAW
jgi:disulfide bond formation protein DsbB